jgi:hypothetical protein
VPTDHHHHVKRRDLRMHVYREERGGGRRRYREERGGGRRRYSEERGGGRRRYTCTERREEGGGAGLRCAAHQ